MTEIGEGSDIKLQHFCIVVSVMARKVSPTPIACIIDKNVDAESCRFDLIV